MAKAKTLLGRLADLFRPDEIVGAAARSVDKMSPEQIYQRSLEVGLPRDKQVERKIDMTKVELPV